MAYRGRRAGACKIAIGAAALLLLFGCGSGPGSSEGSEASEKAPQEAHETAAPSAGVSAPTHRDRDDAGRSEKRAHGRRTRRRKRTVHVLRLGERSPAVARLQSALARLHYWVGAHDGYFGPLTQQAVLAFQGAAGIARDGAVGPETLGALADARPPRPRSSQGDLIEIDEERGLLLVVRDGAVRWAWHTSTGTDENYVAPDGSTHVADTPDGRWTIAWAFDGWRDGPLGRMWRPRYFNPEGVAIHGYAAVPPYPASHGCARVSIPAMNFIWAHDLAAEGSTVWVY